MFIAALPVLVAAFAASHADLTATASTRLANALVGLGVPHAALETIDGVTCEQRLSWPVGTACAATALGERYEATDAGATELFAALDELGALAPREEGSGIHLVVLAATNVRCLENVETTCTADLAPTHAVTVDGADAKRLYDLMGLVGVPGTTERAAHHVSSAFGAPLPDDEDEGGAFDLLFVLDTGRQLDSSDRALCEETRELLTRLGANKIYVEDDSDVFAHELTCTRNAGAYSCRFTVVDADR